MPYDQRSPQRLEDSMIQWLAEGSMAWDNDDDEMRNGYKGTKLSGDEEIEDILSRFDSF